MAPGKPRKSTIKSPSKPVKLLSGGNPQIAKAEGDAPVQAYIAGMPGWKREVGRRIDAPADGLDAPLHDHLFRHLTALLQDLFGFLLEQRVRLLGHEAAQEPYVDGQEFA